MVDAPLTGAVNAQNMIRKSGHRFSEKIMLKQKNYVPQNV
jgi:hypothetical protein